MDPVFRAPMRARAHDAPPGAGAEHGVAHGIVGIGDTDEARIASRIDDEALREAQSRKDAVRAYELVYAALGAPAA